MIAAAHIYPVPYEPATPSAAAPPTVAAVRDALDAEVFAPAAHHRLAASAIARADVPWLGVGLCGTAMSRGLPVDVLGMVAALETLRRALGADRGVVLVADSNAWSEGFTRAEVEPVARHVEETLAAVARALSFPIELVRGSAVAPWEAAAREPSSPELPPYARHQLAQMRAMARAGATVKIGWRLAGRGVDESFFDTQYEASPSRVPMSFVYTIAGRGLDPSRPRACPYVASRPEERVVIAAGEQIGAKLERARETAPREANGYRRLLGKIGRSLARLHGRRPSRPLERDLQELIDRCGLAMPPVAV